MQRMSLRESQKPEDLDDGSKAAGNRRHFGVGHKAPSALNTDVLVAANYLFDLTSPKGGVKDLLEHKPPLPRQRTLRHETLRVVDGLYVSPSPVAPVAVAKQQPSPMAVVTAPVPITTRRERVSSFGVGFIGVISKGEHEAKQHAAALAAAASKHDSVSVTINDDGTVADVGVSPDMMASPMIPSAGNDSALDWETAQIKVSYHYRTH
jgi:hypothetical protein